MKIKMDGGKSEKTDVESVESFEMEIVSEESDDDNEEDLFVKKEKTGSLGKSLIQSGKNKIKCEADIDIKHGKPTAKRCCGPICFILLGIKSLMGVSALTIVLINYFSHSHWLWGYFESSYDEILVGCDDIEVIPVWQSKFPKLLTEGSTRMLNISGDDTLDVVFGFGTGADGYNIPDFVCNIYFRGQTPCLGGIIALDGKDGHELWRLWTPHEIFALTCQADLDGDGVTDCLAGGRAGVFLAVSSKTGKKIWDFGDHAIRSDLMSVYAAQFVEDLDRDGVQDVLAVHGGDGLSDPGHDHMYGRIILFSGKDGKLLRWMATPDRRESFYPPQVTTGPDGRQIVIYGTGGNLNNGALYAISLLDLYRKNINSTRLIYRDSVKGFITPATLVDVTGDGVQDIILATMNSNVLAFDGMSFNCIWNKTFPNSESLTTVAVGLYDKDETPDIFVKYNYGKGFPIYQYEQSMVLSGRNGSVISDIPRDTLATQASPLTISLQGTGNDIFLHWSSNCVGKQGAKIDFDFRAEAHVHERSRADLCRAIFNTGQISRFMAVSRRLGKKGVEVYNSSYWANLEHENAVNTSWLADQYLIKHPEIEESLEDNEDEYSVLPYKNKNFENAIRLLEEELAREYAGEQAFIDPRYLTYSEGYDDPVVADNKAGSNYSIFTDKQLPKPDQQVYNQGTQGVREEPTLSNKNIDSQNDIFSNADSYQRPTNTISIPDPEPQLKIPNIPYGPFIKTRKKRQVPTYQGVQRQSATGTLAPPLILSNDTIDLILPIFWIYPPKVDVLQEEDIRCVRRKIKQATEKTKIFEDSVGFDQLRAEIEEDCLKVTNHFARPDGVYETPSDYDPLSINMGQLVIYRFSLRCKCDSSRLRYGEKCSKVLPYDKQGWPAYMGAMGDTIHRRTRDGL